MPIHGPWTDSFHDLGIYMLDRALQLVHAWIAKFTGTCGHGVGPKDRGGNQGVNTASTLFLQILLVSLGTSS